MKASSPSLKAVEPARRERLTFEHELELPVAPEFVSLPPRVPLAAAIAMMETRPVRKAIPSGMERRLQERITVPFEL